MNSQPSGDLTPETGSPTDISRVGREIPPPAHERTAADEASTAPWEAIASDADFKSLLAAKARFIWPATIFFTVYYFALPIMVGWYPDFMKTKVTGEVNIAYLFALSQFFMAWALAFFYVLAATGWDKRAAAILAKFKR